MGRGDEAGVAAAAAAARRDRNPLTVAQHLAQELPRLGGVDLRPQRHRHDQVFGGSPGAIRALAVAPALRFVEGLEAKVIEGVAAGVAGQDDRAAVTAVAARGPAARHEFLSPEGDAAVTAAAAAHQDDGFVEEDHERHERPRAVRHGGADGSRENVASLAGGGSGGEHVHIGALPAPVLELHDAADLGEQGVVLAAPDVAAGEEAGAALAHDDRAALDGLAAERLDPEALRLGIAAVASRALTFLMSHDEPFRTSERDVLDAHPQQVLPVAARAAVALAALLLEHHQLGAAHLVDHHPGDRRAVDRRTAHPHAALAVHHEHSVESDLLHLLAAHRLDLDLDHVAALDPVLLAATLDDREHPTRSPGNPKDWADSAQNGTRKLPQAAARGQTAAPSGSRSCR